jgi:hypothetical protein
MSSYFELIDLVLSMSSYRSRESAAVKLTFAGLAGGAARRCHFDVDKVFSGRKRAF